MTEFSLFGELIPKRQHSIAPDILFFFSTETGVCPLRKSGSVVFAADTQHVAVVYAINSITRQPQRIYLALSTIFFRINTSFSCV